MFFYCLLSIDKFINNTILFLLIYIFFSVLYLDYLLQLMIWSSDYMELIRVVDEDGNDTDEVLEREDVHDLSKLHNEVTIYIINKKGEILLQRRSKNRRFCPNMLGVIAGHVGYLEDPLSCAKRELEEEVGLVVDKNEVHVLCNKYLVLEDENNHFMYPYYVITDLEEDDFIIQKEEVSYVKWHNIDDVINLIEVGDKELVFKKEEIYLFRMLKDIVS